MEIFPKISLKNLRFLNRYVEKKENYPQIVLLKYCANIYSFLLISQIWLFTFLVGCILKFKLFVQSNFDTYFKTDRFD